MNVLFLDFDGPLFPYNKITNVHPWPKGLTLHPFIQYWKMDTQAVSMLNQLKQIHPFKTVISSSWKKYVDFPNMQHLFKVNNLNMDFHDDPIAKRMSFGYTSRAQDISSWLDDNPVNDYIVLDDPDSGKGLKDSKLKNVHLVNPTFGLDVDTFRSMKNIVRGWNDRS